MELNEREVLIYLHNKLKEELDAGKWANAKAISEMIEKIK